jgi:site-specific DNA-methyltransferase (adenine-specific)
MFYEKSSSAFPATPTANRYTQTIEYMFILSKGKPKTAHLICDKKNLHPGSGSGWSSRRNRNGALVKYHKKEIPEYSPRNNIWRYSVGNGSASQKIAHEHPAIFPEALVHDHLRTWTDEGDLVLDCFNGSGTTSAVAKAMGRKFIGVDVSDEYCEIARKRLLLPIDLNSLKEKSETSNNHRCPEDTKPTPSHKKTRLTSTQFSDNLGPPEKWGVGQ